MHLLSHEESASATDGFLLTIYGEEILRKWKELKEEMEFVSEREYMSWLIDVAYHYKASEAFVDLTEDEAERAAYSTQAGAFRMDDATSSSNRDAATNQNNYNSHLTSAQIGHYKSEEVKETFKSSGHDSDVVEIEGESNWAMQPSATAGPLVPLASDTSQSLQVVHDGLRKTVCDYCSYSHVKKFHVRRHMLAVHEKVKPFSCPHCNYGSSQKEHLKSHLIYKHGYASKHTCETCGKRFHSKAYLNSHNCQPP